MGHAKIIHKLDVVLKDFLHVGGVFHGAVEVYGKEWSFSIPEEGLELTLKAVVDSQELISVISTPAPASR